MPPLGLMRAVRLNRPMLQRRICAVVEFLAFIYWASLTLNFFGLRTRGATPQHVVEVLKRVAGNQPGIAKQPTPQAYVVSFASVAISFNLRVWTDQYEDWIQVRSDLAVAVDEALTRENIAIA
jgi:hypothetical protein